MKPMGKNKRESEENSTTTDGESGGPGVSDLEAVDSLPERRLLDPEARRLLDGEGVVSLALFHDPECEALVEGVRIEAEGGDGHLLAYSGERGGWVRLPVGEGDDAQA